MSRPAPIRLFVEHVTHIDCGVLTADYGLVGRTWLVDAVLSGRPGDDGMLLDFGPAKRLLKREIDAAVDHRLLVPARLPGLKCDNRRLSLTAASGARLDYRGPAAGTRLFDTEKLDADWLAGWLAARVRAVLPPAVAQLTLTLRCETGKQAFYHYCHGLRGHAGDCQRLGHGHRGRLAVYVDHEPRPDLARDWASAWQGVFIGDRADVIGTDASGRCRIGYDAAQGRFELALDAARCVLLDGPATIEHIAGHVADTLAARLPGRAIEVRAHEGVGKGAIATRLAR